MRLYLKYFEMHLRKQLHYRTSFLFITLGQALFSASSLIIVLILMPEGKEILGFSRYEVLLCGAIINLSYATAECFARGFDTFGSLLKMGDFDRAVVRPVSEIRQIFMMTLDFTRLGRFSVGLITLVWVLNHLPTISIPYLIFLILTGTFIYTCLFIIYGAICFYTTENLEAFNILTDGTKEFGKAPYIFYGEYVLKALTFIIPLALIQYYPLMYLLNKSGNISYLYIPLLAYLFIIPTLLFWRQGRKHYTSTGS